MKKLLSRAGIVLVIFPLTVLLLQIMFRLAFGKDLNTIGITLGAMGLGQLFPFLYFDHFVANKVLGIRPSYEVKNSELIITYKVNPKIEASEIEEVKNIVIAVTFLSLGLFMVIVFFGLRGDIFLHTTFGIISCFISWYILVFK